MGLNKWPKRGDRITQNFGELIFYISQSQWPPRLKRGVCGRSLTGIVSSHTAGSMDICLLWKLCSHVQISALGWSLFQRSSTNCGVSIECDREAPSWGTTAWNHVRGATEGGGGLLYEGHVKSTRRKKNWLIWGLGTKIVGMTLVQDSTQRWTLEVWYWWR